MTQTPEAPLMDERDAQCRAAAREFLEGAIDADVLLNRIREACAAYTEALAGEDSELWPRRRLRKC